jgi:hypothetical protein
MTRQRLLLIALMLWGIFMIVPDLVRVVSPLSSFGFYANNDGLIFDVKGPFANEGASPAWKAGVRVGDRVDLERMRCRLKELKKCGDALAFLGGLEFVVPGKTATLYLAESEGKPAREITLVAAQRPSNALVRALILLNQVAGLAVVIASAWLVWTRPSRMTWGFFLYANWFNPGQVYAFYAILGQFPPLLVLQEMAANIAEAAGYMGLLQFAISAPNNVVDKRWQTLERALPLIGLVLAVMLLGDDATAFGLRTETLTRAAIFAGFVVDFCALAVLYERRRTQTPEDYQRLRWLIWGCVIGLPSFLIADLASMTTFFETRFGDFTPSEDIILLLYLVNGIFCLFVFEALRRKRVVSVSIPLRRVTILGLILSFPVLLLHREIEHLPKHLAQLALPSWAWIVIGVVFVFLLTRLHEGTVHLVDRYFNRALDAAERELGGRLLSTRRAADIDRLLTDEPARLLKLTSAAAFRKDGSVFRRAGKSEGWGDSDAKTLEPNLPLLAPVAKGESFPIGEADAPDLDLPTGLSRPVLGVPAANPVRCLALSLYGPHASGTDLDANERGMLARLGERAAAMYAELENSEMRARLAELEGTEKDAPHGDL